MFTIFPRLMKKETKILILDPMYGEYAHIFENVTGSQIIRHFLNKENNFVVGIQQLQESIQKTAPDIVVLVNPNSPTGQFHETESYLTLVTMFPQILFVIDETYIDYVQGAKSLELEATKKENLIAIKSMSKAYALSGARVAYMVAHKKIIEKLIAFFPPWSVSLLGQIAWVEALKDPLYYQKKYQETHELRKEMEELLQKKSTIKVYPWVANFVLIELLSNTLSAKTIVKNLRKNNIFIRNCSSMGTSLGDKFLRLAVKDKKTNKALLDALWNELL